MDENEIGSQIIAAAIEVHRELGPGLLESVHEVVLARELSIRGLAAERQVPVPIVFKGIRHLLNFGEAVLKEWDYPLCESVGKMTPAETQRTRFPLLCVSAPLRETLLSEAGLSGENVGDRPQKSPPEFLPEG